MVLTFKKKCNSQKSGQLTPTVLTSPFVDRPLVYSILAYKNLEIIIFSGNIYLLILVEL